MLRLLFILLFIFSALFGENIALLESKEGAIVLRAQGYAKTPEAAKKNALQELVFHLKSQIETSYELRENVKDDKLKQEVQSKVSMQGRSFFEGVHYSDATLKNGFFETEAVITTTALEKTMLALYKDINVDIELRSKKERQVMLEKIATLKILLSYANKEMNLSTISVQKIESKKRELYQSLNMAKVFFQSNANNATITIKNKTYKQGEFFYLEPGNYKYIVKSDGYHEEKGLFYAQAGYAKTVDKKLIEKSDAKIKIYIHSDGLYKIEEDVASILSQYDVGVSLSSQSTNAFDFTFHKEFLMQIGSTKFYKFSLSVNAYRGKELYMSKKASLKRVSETRLASNSSRLVKALTKALLKKLDLEVFKNKQSVNYKNIL